LPEGRQWQKVLREQPDSSTMPNQEGIRGRIRQRRASAIRSSAGATRHMHAPQIAAAFSLERMAMAARRAQRHAAALLHGYRPADTAPAQQRRAWQAEQSSTIGGRTETSCRYFLHQMPSASMRETSIARVSSPEGAEARYDETEIPRVAMPMSRRVGSNQPAEARQIAQYRSARPQECTALRAAPRAVPER